MKVNSAGKFFKIATSAALIGFGAWGTPSTQISSAADLTSLRSPKPDGTPIQVTAKVEVGGNLKVAPSSTAAKDAAKDASKDSDKTPDKNADTVPMSVVAEFGYDEQRLDDGSEAAHRLAIRRYDSAQATIKIGSKTTKPQLRDNRKLVAAVGTKDSVYLSSTDGPLTRDELELIDIPANTLILDQLLPQADVEVGKRWDPSADVMARFMCLDAVGHTEVHCTLNKVTDGVAEIGMEGTLGGAIDGVATEIELKARLMYDVKRNLPKSLLLAIKEQRGIGHVGPGLDVVAKIKLTVAPQPESKLLTSDIVQSAKLPQSDEAPPLEYIADKKGFRFVYDRHWHLTRDDSDLLVMRLIERGDLVAQCNVAGAEVSADKPMELTEFQTDVQQALGKLFGAFERAKESNTDSGLRVLLSSAIGKAEELPIQWRYYLVHDKQGHAVNVIFTMETALADQFHDQDAPIIQSVEFFDRKLASRK